MNLRFVVLVTAAFCMPGWAQQTAVEPTPAPPPASAPAAGQKATIEPDVQHIVVEDDDTRIDELRVRGQTQRITVTPKSGGASYEVIPANGLRDLPDSADNRSGAAGKRVWRVLNF